MRHFACGFFGLLFALSCHASLAQGVTSTVPLGGNAYITQASPTNNEVITDTGLHNWNSSETVISVYFDVQQAGDLQLSLVGALSGASHSQVQVSVGNQSRLVTLSSTAPSPFPVGSFMIDHPGYVKVNLRGISTDGGYFGDISGLQIAGSATAAGTVYANDPANFHWSRRGPSVHLAYEVPDNTEYFYSEVTVPEGQDPVGSYYMADGFNGGYFGMQVKSPTERWILFSVWDSPTEATTLLKQGPGVIIDSFDNEGTGGKSHLRYPWVAGETYRFITRAQPDGNGNTLFTAWFSSASARENCPARTHRANCGWHLIATWIYHGTSTYLRSVYSFLESFDPDRGYIGRSAHYGNQWAVSAAGDWTEITSAYYDVDPTGLNGQRLDYAGGTIGTQFFLRNDGFFSNSTPSGQTFTRTATGVQPDVNLDTLP